jgi:colanic acid/amylovoran biosynthesis glycosyltransferase
VTAADGDQEGTPVSLMEAQACGVPVVSTLHSGIPEVVPDGRAGVLVPERDVDRLAAALAELLKRADRWAAMGEQGRTHVKAFYDLRSLNQEQSSLYERLRAEFTGRRRSRPASGAMRVPPAAPKGAVG